VLLVRGTPPKKIQPEQELMPQETGQEGPEERRFTVTDEQVVAATDADGNFVFVFEPLADEDLWVFFMADGYRTRAVDLKERVRSRFFTKPNKTPVNVDVVLEKSEE
jgi:hypothetical protein